MKVTAKAIRTGKWWAVEVVEVPGVFTQARRLDQVGAQVIDAVRTMEEDPSVEVVVEAVHQVQGVAGVAARQAREQAAAAEEKPLRHVRR